MVYKKGGGGFGSGSRFPAIFLFRLQASRVCGKIPVKAITHISVHFEETCLQRKNHESRGQPLQLRKTGPRGLPAIRSPYWIPLARLMSRPRPRQFRPLKQPQHRFPTKLVTWLHVPLPVHLIKGVMQNFTGYGVAALLS
ncbi:uncharacterized protein LOC111112582 isoform X4 [Crassostrea virginica]